MQLNPIYAKMGVTIFEHMSALCRDGSRINLGQGFPEDNGPAELREAAGRALMERSNQYPPSAGVPELRDAVCAYYAREQGLDLTREQVIVTSGATEALADAILAVTRPGDEVIVFAPAFDVYAPLIRRAGATPVFVNLAPPLWRYDTATVEAAVTARTRAILINDPLNPTGTVASAEELAALAQICVQHDLVAISDEVWEAVRFDGMAHRSLIGFPGMAERTIKIGSAGKIFGLTGWKVGWMCAAPALATVLTRAHQFVTFTTAVPLQYAVAQGLDQPDIIESRRAGWSETRSALAANLAAEGLIALPNAATWFTCIDLTASGIALDDATFAERAVHEARVATIPLAAFYEGTSVDTVLRLCHCKPAATLNEAVTRLARFRDALVAAQ